MAEKVSGQEAYEKWKAAQIAEQKEGREKEEAETNPLLRIFDKLTRGKRNPRIVAEAALGLSEPRAQQVSQGIDITHLSNEEIKELYIKYGVKRPPH